MNTTKRGKLEVMGTLSEIKADLSVIVHGIYNNALLEEMSEEEAREFIFDAVDRALKSNEETEKEADEILGKMDDLIEGLEDFLELLASKGKGQGEK